MRIDFEAHYITPEFRHLIDGDVPPPPFMAEGVNRMLDIGEGRLAILDEAGIDIQVLSAAGKINSLPQKDAVHLAHSMNRDACAALRKYPDRFRAMAALAVADVPTALDELRLCMETYGFSGWHTDAHYGEEGGIADDRFFPLLEYLEGQGGWLYIHPTPPVGARLNDMGRQISFGYGYSYEVCIALLGLIRKGTLDRLPGLKILIGHLGEGLPFFLDRIDRLAEKLGETGETYNQHPFGYYFRHNILVTTSGNFSQGAFQSAKSYLGIDRMLFATDYATESLKESIDFVSSMCADEGEREAVFCGNAVRHLNILGK